MVAARCPFCATVVGSLLPCTPSRRPQPPPPPSGRWDEGDGVRGSVVAVDRICASDPKWRTMQSSAVRSKNAATKPVNLGIFAFDLPQNVACRLVYASPGCRAVLVTVLRENYRNATFLLCHQAAQCCDNMWNLLLDLMFVSRFAYFCKTDHLIAASEFVGRNMMQFLPICSAIIMVPSFSLCYLAVISITSNFDLSFHICYIIETHLY